MAGASGNRFSLAFKRETTPGIAPTGNYGLLRLTSEDIKRTRQYVTSNELRSDRQIPDTIPTLDGGGGQFSGELSYGAYDEIFESALFSANWVDSAVVVSGVSCTVTSNVVAGTGIDAGWAVGDYAIFTLTTANRGKIGRVAALASGQITFDSVTLTEVVGATATTIRKLGYAQVGVTEVGRSFTFEKQWNDETLYQPCLGGDIDTITLSVSVGQIITVDFSTLCMSVGDIATSSIAGTPTVTGTGTVMSPIDNARLAIGGVQQTVLTDFTFNLSNSLEARNVIGSSTAESIRKGRAQVSGQFSGLLQDETIYNRFANAESTNVALIFQDFADADGGNAYVFDLARVKHPDATIPTTGIDTDVVQQIEFTSILDPTLGRSLRIWRTT